MTQVSPHVQGSPVLFIFVPFAQRCYRAQVKDHTQPCIVLNIVPVQRSGLTSDAGM